MSHLCYRKTARRQFSAVLLDEFAFMDLRDYLLLSFYSFSFIFLSCLLVLRLKDGNLPGKLRIIKTNEQNARCWFGQRMLIKHLCCFILRFSLFSKICEIFIMCDLLFKAS